MALWHLIVHEIECDIRQSWVRILIAASVLLAAAVVAVGIRDYRIGQEHYLQAIEARAIERNKASLFLTGRSIESALRVLRPPMVGSIFVRGAEAGLPINWDFGPAGVITGPIGQTLRQQSGAAPFLDFEELVRFVLGFLAIVLGLETLARQRANGNLEALLAQPATPRLVLAGKVLAALAILTAAVFLVCVAALAMMWVNARDLFSGQVLLIIGFLGGSSVLYLGVMLIGGLMISVIGKTYDAAVTLGTVVWFVVTLLAPEVVSVGPRALAPVPPIQDVESERQTLYSGRLHLTEQLLGNTGYRLMGDRAYKIGPETDKVTLAEIDRLWMAEAMETRQLLNAVNERFIHALAAQKRIGIWLALASPATIFEDLVADVADSGRAAESRWNSDIATHERLLETRVFDDRARLVMLIPMPDGGPRTVTFNRHSFPSIRDIPDVEPVPWSTSSLLAACSGRVGLLAGYWIVLLAVTIGTFPRFGR
jgi:ABC-type transport system involved in multi-copper enzyme maturation permease subunit